MWGLGLWYQGLPGGQKLNSHFPIPFPTDHTLLPIHYIIYTIIYFLIKVKISRKVGIGTHSSCISINYKFPLHLLICGNSYFKSCEKWELATIPSLDATRSHYHLWVQVGTNSSDPAMKLTGIHALPGTVFCKKYQPRPP